MKKNSVSHNNTFTQNHLMMIWAFCVLLFLFIFHAWRNYNIPSTKTDFAKWYGVDKKTFNKWVKHFCHKLYPDLSVYQRKRKLSKQEAKAIRNVLGTLDDYPILSKKEILQHCESSYGILRRCVYAYPKKFGLTTDAFKSTQKFPPKISRNIISQFDPDRVELIKKIYSQLTNGDDLTTCPKKS